MSQPQKTSARLFPAELVKIGDHPTFDETDKRRFELSSLWPRGDGSAGEQTLTPPAAIHSSRAGTKEVLLRIRRARANRSKFLPGELFADPAWDMLLDLYLGDIVGKRICISSLCAASNVPSTTALRWVNTLEATGLIQREADPHHGRRYFVTLSKSGLQQMDDYFQSL